MFLDVSPPLLNERGTVGLPKLEDDFDNADVGGSQGDGNKDEEAKLDGDCSPLPCEKCKSGLRVTASTTSRACKFSGVEAYREVIFAQLQPVGYCFPLPITVDPSRIQAR
jgi:hypothetical protein